MTARDARLVLPGQWVLPEVGVRLPGFAAGAPAKVHHVEVLPLYGADRHRHRDRYGVDEVEHEVALCLLQRGAHPGHTAEDARNGGGGQVHPARPGTQAVGAVAPEPWPILWLPIGHVVEIVPPPPPVRVEWAHDRQQWVVRVEGKLAEVPS